jgi:toxin CptA
MASHRHRPPLLVRPRPSLQLAVFVALSHALALLIALALPVALPGRLALMVPIGLSAAWGVLTHLWPRTPWAVREALLSEDGWEVVLGSGRRRPARLAPSTFVGTWLMVLNFRCPPRLRCSLVLPPDALEPEVQRRLRVRLRLATPGMEKVEPRRELRPRAGGAGV